LFCGSKFAHWRKLTWRIIKDIDYELWLIIVKGEFVLIVQYRDKIVRKRRSYFFHEQIEKVAKTTKHFIQWLHSNAFDRVFACDTAKEIQHTFETTYEGSSQVRESKLGSMSISVSFFRCHMDNPSRISICTLLK